MRRPIRSKSEPERINRRSRAPNVTQRSYLASAVWALIAVGITVVLSAVINPLLGRVVHWDWMAVAAPALFLAVAVALRRRWI